MLFGSGNTYSPPSILFNPDTVYFRVVGTPVNGIDMTTRRDHRGDPRRPSWLLMRFTNLGLQMRGAVESRRLIELDGVNAGRVVATAWAISGLMAGLAGVLLAPTYGELQFSDYAALMVAAFAAAAWAVLRSMPIAALVGIADGCRGHHPAGVPAGEQRLVLGRAHLAALHRAGGRAADRARVCARSTAPRTPCPRSTRPPRRRRPPSGPPSSTGSSGWAGTSCLAAFVVSMLTWMPTTWENVFNAGLVFSIVFLSITLITGMGGQLSLAQATLAGVGAFTAAQLANHWVSACSSAAWWERWPQPWWPWSWPSPRCGYAGSGLALLTIAAALFFDNTVFPQLTSTNGAAIDVKPKWVGLGITRPERPRLLHPGHGRAAGLHPGGASWSAGAPRDDSSAPCGGARRPRPAWASTSAGSTS